ncbi:hypothetical protein LCGC14_2501820 [marine sediment metagenome]|uniref:Uncharacterized protein n=1 Tax=marine sediment metagenome TaxID=412755 RepID=A0A0F9B2F9_9ZZZZ
MFGDNFLGFDYDVHVGEGLEPTPATRPNLQGMWLSLTQKRIDVVGYHGNEIWLIEIKDRPMTASVGQVLSYDVLYAKDYSPATPVILAIIAGIIEPDIETVLRHFKIRFYDLSDDHNFLLSSSNKPLVRSSPE